MDQFTSGTQTRAFIAGISGVSVTGAAVLVSSSGQLGVAASSARFKKDIQSMNQASDALLALRPVTFHYKEESCGCALLSDAAQLAPWTQSRPSAVPLSEQPPASA